MRDAEFDRLLDIVRSTVAVEEPDAFLEDGDVTELPFAANDNEREWPLLPFPTGWIASC